MTFPSTSPTLSERLRTGAPVLAAGLMSGTSADGLDVALVEVGHEDEKARVRLRYAALCPYPEPLRAALFRCFEDRATVSELCLLHALWGEFAADAIAATLAEAGIPPSELAFVASHGQTVWHQPEPLPFGGAAGVRGTLQIGETARIAERFGVPVVGDFRQQDVALGGQGAPLVPYFDYLLLSHPTENRAVQNLGGIGNVTFLKAGGRADEVIAFDTGPANALIDAAVELVTNGAQQYDGDGRMADTASVDPVLLAELLTEPYLALPPPKSTGRELFSAGRVRELWDRGFRDAGLVSTLTQFTAETMLDAYERWLGPLDVLILGGGGARNLSLVRRVQQGLSQRGARTRVVRLDELGYDGDAKEAIAFALLGYETLRGIPSNVPSATGATRPAVQGKICWP